MKTCKIKLSLIEAIEVGAFLTTITNNEPNNSELNLFRSAVQKITDAISSQFTVADINEAEKDLEIQELLGNTTS